MSDAGCHVYLVAACPIAQHLPRGDCFACGQPLRYHTKRISPLAPDDGKAFVIDEVILSGRSLSR